MAKYPRIFIPEELKKIRYSRPIPKRLRDFPKEPVRSQPLVYPVIETHVKPQFQRYNYGRPLKTIAFSALFIYIITSAIEDIDGLLFIILILIIIILISAWWMTQIPKENKRRLEQYDSELISFKKKELEAKQTYDSMVTEYENKEQDIENKYAESLITFHEEEKPRFLYNLNEYENHLEELRHPEIVSSYQLAESKRFLKNATVPVLVDKENMKQLQRGVLEIFFYEILEEEFGPHVRLDMGLKKGNAVMLPDILVFNKSEGLYIAIEIDEPYVGATGEIIHYDSDKLDQERVYTFNKNGWTVVRFAEEQINAEPFLCLELIRNLAVDLVKNSNYHNTSNTGIPAIKTWNKDQAYKMGFHRYRSTYLMSSYQNIVNEEKNTPYKEVAIY